MEIKGSQFKVWTETIPAVAQMAADALPGSHTSATLNGWAAVESYVSAPGSTTAETGLISPWPSNAAPPAGWLLCAGQEVSRTTYAALFAVINTAFGAGNGVDTFRLPDLRGRTIVGKDDMGGPAAGVLSNKWGTTLGKPYGKQIVDVDHSHNLAASNVSVSWNAGKQDGYGGRWIPDDAAMAQDVNGRPVINSSIKQLDVMNPCLIMNWIIKY
ncbi:MAG: tail fiber protein [Candidatus Omnitrophica bacterium]|nr:tail fiber protein [Candidatus Omnitrophota bacterium]